MKKKLFLAFIMTIAFILMLAFVVSAEDFTHEGKVDLNETVTLNDGTVLNLFDSDGEALIWYISGTSEGKNTYSSIRSDDSQVKWFTESWGEVTGVGINFDAGGSVDKTNFVVVNMMDDDVVANYNVAVDSVHYGKPIKSFKFLFRNCTNLEYLYLRLDTTGFYKESFANSKKLKYINLEDLYELESSRDSYQFSGCSSLFAGQVLDLSHTKLYELTGSNTFNSVPIIGLKLPRTLTSLGGEVFKNNPSVTFAYPENLIAMPNDAFNNAVNLQTIYINSALASIANNAFLDCDSLNRICFVGTKDQLEALIANTSTTGNDAFFAVAGENNANVISYADYLALEDKSGKYAIYDYSYCEAFNYSIHEAVDAATDCTKDADCKNCTLKGAIKSTYKSHKYVEFLTYTTYTEGGKYKYECQNAEFCTLGNRYKDTDPLFLAPKGFSTNGDDGIAGGYTINVDALNEYKRINGSLTVGIMVINPNYLDGKDSFLDEHGMVNTNGGALQVDMTNNLYKNVDVSIKGFTGNAESISLIIALFAYDEPENVEFIQSRTTQCGDKNVTIGEETLYTVTLASVKAGNSDLSNLGDYIMPSNDEEE